MWSSSATLHIELTTVRSCQHCSYENFEHGALGATGVDLGWVLFLHHLGPLFDCSLVSICDYFLGVLLDSTDVLYVVLTPQKAPEGVL
jgi:hypothetical protein